MLGFESDSETSGSRTRLALSFRRTGWYLKNKKGACSKCEMYLPAVASAWAEVHTVTVCLRFDGTVREANIRGVGDEDAGVPSEDIEVGKEDLLHGLHQKRRPDLCTKIVFSYVPSSSALLAPLALLAHLAQLQGPTHARTFGPVIVVDAPS